MAGLIHGCAMGKQAWRRLLRNKMAMGSVLVLGLIIALCLLGPLFSPHPYDEIYWDAMGVPPDAQYWFGTDANGRDLWVRTLMGGRVSLAVGLAATAVSLLIGVLYGATAGYVGGRTDALMMRLVDVLYALPFMFFVILLMVYFGRSIFLIFCGDWRGGMADDGANCARASFIAERPRFRGSRTGWRGRAFRDYPPPYCAEYLGNGAGLCDVDRAAGDFV